MSSADTLTRYEPESEVLLRASQPDLFRVNAFRITGLPVDANAQQIMRQVEKLRMAEKFGGSTRWGGPLPLEPAPDGDLLRNAIQRLRDPEMRLVDEFFWFWPHRLGGGNEDEALVALAGGEDGLAAEIWSRLESQNSVSKVSMHNLAVLSHAKVLDFELSRTAGFCSADWIALCAAWWRSAFSRWKILLDDEEFWNRVTARIGEFDDPRLTPETANRMRKSLPLALLNINGQLAIRAAQAGDTGDARRQVSIMEESGFARDLVLEALRRILDPIRKRIKALCIAAEKEAEADDEHADKATRRLLEQSQPLLATIDCLLPAGDQTRDGVHDEVALAALTCQIIYGNRTKDWRTSVELFDKILAIAASDSARSRIEQNLLIVRDNDEFGTCFFCHQTPTEKGSEASVTMHGNVRNEYVAYNTTRTTWSHNTFIVPRCGDCAQAHRGVASARTYGRLLAFLSVVSFFVSMSWWGEYVDGVAEWGWYMLIGAIAAFITPLYLWRAFGRVRLQDRAPEEKKYEFRTILERRKQGWNFGQTPPGQAAPPHRPNRGKLLAAWAPFNRWASHRRPIFASMFALWLPVVPVLASVPVIWGFAVGTPAAIRDLYRMRLLSQTRAVDRLTSALSREGESDSYRKMVRSALSVVRPGLDLDESPTARQGSPDRSTLDACVRVLNWNVSGERGKARLVLHIINSCSQSFTLRGRALLWDESDRKLGSQRFLIGTIAAMASRDFTVTFDPPANGVRFSALESTSKADECVKVPAWDVKDHEGKPGLVLQVVNSCSESFDLHGGALLWRGDQPIGSRRFPIGTIGPLATSELTVTFDPTASGIRFIGLESIENLTSEECVNVLNWDVRNAEGKASLILDLANSCSEGFALRGKATLCEDDREIGSQSFAIGRIASQEARNFSIAFESPVNRIRFDGLEEVSATQPNRAIRRLQGAASAVPSARLPASGSAPESVPRDVSSITTLSRSYSGLSDGRASLLSLEITSDKVRLSSLSLSFQKCQMELNSYKDSITSDRQRLDQMESNARLGIRVESWEYDTIRNRHNSTVNMHNNQLQQCRSLGQEHDDLVERINAKVREYNTLIGAR